MFIPPVIIHAPLCYTASFRAAVAIAALLFLVDSCGGDGVAAPDNSIARVTLDPPSATMRVGETLQLAAKTFNAGNTPIAGAGGFTFVSNDNAIVTVSATGLLHALRIGSSVVTAKVGSFQQTALITVTAGFPGTLNKLAGDNSSAETLSRVNLSSSVEVRDSVGNAVSGVTVTFAVGTGGGTITGATAATGGSGVATVGSWTLGSTAGQNTLTASVNGAASVIATTFVATAVPSSPTQLIVTAASTSVPIGVPFPIPASVEVHGRSGRVVPGRRVP